MGDLFEYLTSARPEKTADGEQLRLLGVKAARAYIDNDVPLNDSIVSFAKEAHLSEEKVRRVVEFANNHANTEKMKAGYDTNITFPLADTSAIMQVVGAGSVKTASVSRTYVPAPKWRPGPEVTLENIFAPHSATVRGRLEGETKVASAGTLNYYDEYGDRRDLAGVELRRKGAYDAHRIAKDDLLLAEQRVLSKLASLSRLVAQAIHSGDSPEAVAAAVGLAEPSKELLSIVQHELGDNYRPADMRKLAAEGVEVDPNNPVTGLIQDLAALSEKLVAADEHVQNTKAAVDQLMQFLQGQPDQSPTNQLFADEAPNIALQQMQQQQAQAQQAAQQPQGQPGQPQQGQPQQGQPQPGQ